MDHDGSATTLDWRLEGRLGQGNAHALEDEVRTALRASGATSVRFEAEGLDYIASAGIRTITRLLKSGIEVSLVDASRDVYDVFDMVGLTALMEVERVPRQVDPAGLHRIGEGANGCAYRTDDGRVAEVYDKGGPSRERVERECAAAREALACGILAAPPLETIRAGDAFGVVYEPAGARTIGQAVAAEPRRCDEWARRLAAFVRGLHTTEMRRDRLPDARLVLNGWTDVAEASGLHAPSAIARLRGLVDGIGDAATFVHGDLHPASVLVTGDDELVLIDLADASVGHPAIDLAGISHVMRVAVRRPGGATRLLGMPLELVDRLWSAFVRAYFATDDATDVEWIERALAFVALPRAMGDNARSRLIDDETRARRAKELERALMAGCPDLDLDGLRPRR